MVLIIELNTTDATKSNVASQVAKKYPFSFWLQWKRHPFYISSSFQSNTFLLHLFENKPERVLSL